MAKTTLNLFFILLVFTFLSCNKNDIDVPQNKVPIANAGISDTVVLTKNNLELNGSGTDEDGTIVAYLWSQISGPEATIIKNPGSAATTVECNKQGSYVFQLMVTDNDGATGVDTVSIFVKPAPVQTLVMQPSNNPYEYQVTSLNGQNLT